MTSAAPTVLQVSGFLPERVGGTEIYLEGFVRELSRLGISSSFLVPREADAPESYRHAETLVETYPVNEIPFASEMRDNKPHEHFEVFRRLLSRHKGAIYHQHAWTRGCSGHHLRAAREQGLRTVLTVHVPSNICIRGTMLRFGETACDGRVEATTCGACWAQSRGMPKTMAQVVGRLPLGAAIRARQIPTRVATALSARALGADKLRDVREMIDNSDRIVAVCGWVRDALLANGAPPEKLRLNRQGVSNDYLQAVQDVRRGLNAAPGTLNLLYLGSWNPVKGVDVVVSAVRSLPEATPVRLTIRAPGGATEEQRVYETRVRDRAQADARISIEGPVSRDALASLLSAYDALVVPSVCLETGPLVVLEAQAAGLFILGSRLGGIAELVADGDGGELVAAGSVVAWATAIADLVRRNSQRPLPRMPRPVRTMTAVAAEMAGLYRSL